MVKEKRKARAYKIADKPYERAMKRAGKEKGSLATIIEDWVIMYGEGAKVGYSGTILAANSKIKQ